MTFVLKICFNFRAHKNTTNLAAEFTAYSSFVGRHRAGLPRGCLVQRTYTKEKIKHSHKTRYFHVLLAEKHVPLSKKPVRGSLL